MAAATKLILASASPRRVALLDQIGLTPDAIQPSHIDESLLPGETPRQAALRLARGKVNAAAPPDGAVVLAADTLVACGRRILPKAEDRDTAAQCLSLLSGRRHRVYGGLAVRGPDGTVRERLCITQVKFHRLSQTAMATYLDSGDWHGKAGGYGIQGPAGAFVAHLSGSYSNVVGLALDDTVRLLAAAGYAPAQALL